MLLCTAQVVLTRTYTVTTCDGSDVEGDRGTEGIMCYQVAGVLKMPGWMSHVLEPFTQQPLVP